MKIFQTKNITYSILNIYKITRKTKELNYFPYIVVKKNFSESYKTNLNQRTPLIQENLKETSKKITFYYRKIEYNSSLPSNVDISVKDFLNLFDQKYDFTPNSENKKNYQDYQIFKNGRYAPLDFLINRIDTYRDAPSPLTLIDFDLNFQNFSYRNITNYKNPIESHSNKLQVFLNTFLENTKVKQFDNNYIPKMLKTIPNFVNDSNRLHQLAASLIGNDNTEGVFKTGVNIDLSNIDRKSLNNITTLRSNVNDFIIPLTLVKDSIKNITDKKITNYNKDLIG